MSIPQALFIHVPRTGGQSIERAFGSNIYHFDHNNLTASQERLSDVEWERVWKFTILRDPWRRAYSAFLLHHQSRPHLRAKWQDDAETQRKLFRRWWRSDDKAGNWYRHYAPGNMFGPYIDELDHVFKFEAGVSNVIQTVARKCKIRYTGSPLHKHNRSRLETQPLGMVIPPGIADEIEEIGWLEIERFKYSAPIIT